MKYLIMFLLTGITAAFSAEIYVSPQGKENGNGSMEKPFRSLQKAVDAVRQLRNSENTEPVTIYLRQGRYQLNQTLVLGINDGVLYENKADFSGASKADGSTGLPYLTFASCPGENAVISSGVPVNGWKLAEQLPDALPAVSQGKVWVAEIPEQLDTFYTLYDSQGRLSRARGGGFNPVKEGTRRTLHFPPGALKNWSNLKDVEIMVRPKNPWTLNMLPLSSVDEKTGTAQTAVSATYELSPLKTWAKNLFGISVWVENTLDALDEPGEWVIDSRIRKVYLWPRNQNADGSPHNILAPALTELVRVEGNIDYDGPVDTPVRGIAFKRLTFTHGDRRAWISEEDRLGWGLQHDWEMFDRPTALLRFRGAQDCLVQECRFVTSGGTGLRLDLHAQYNRIIDNEFSHLGEAGILLAGYGPGTKDVNHHNQILNNHVHHFSEIIWHAPGIWAWQSGYNRIAYNYVHHSAYSGILVTCRIKPTFGPESEGGRTIRKQEIPAEAMTGGKTFKDWEIREKYIHARHNLVEYNRISHVMKKLSDGNGIYVSGAGFGNMIRYNYLHNMDSPTVTESIRCDDDQHETLIYGNIVEDGIGHSVLCSKGKNYIINNFVLHSKDDFHRAIISFERYPVDGAVVRDNIVVGHEKGGSILKYTKIGADSYDMLKVINADNNLYFHVSDSNWADEYLEKMRAVGLEENSRFADPLFVDYAARNYVFQQGSPALEMGIESLEKKSLMGLRKNGTESNIQPLEKSDSTPGLRYAGDKLIINLPPNSGDAELTIHSLSGESIKVVELSSSSTSFGLRDLARGWYLTRVKMKDWEARTQFYHKLENNSEGLK